MTKIGGSESGSISQRHGSASTPKCHGSATLQEDVLTCGPGEGSCRSWEGRSVGAPWRAGGPAPGPAPPDPGHALPPRSQSTPNLRADRISLHLWCQSRPSFLSCADTDLGSVVEP
jgi:hypothetical protein